MRRVLLVAPPFFGYYRDISSEIERMGYQVDWLPDRPSDSVLFKSLSRFSYDLVQGKIDRHADLLSRLLESHHYDFVLFVGGMSFCFKRSQMVRFRSVSQARFCVYLWDSLDNCQRVNDSLDLFDDSFSFDTKDCAKANLRFLPLFYTREYESVPDKPRDGFEYDACFIGSVHQPSKFERVLGIVEQLKLEGAKVYTHYYMPSRSSAFLRAVQSQAYRRVSLSFNTLPRHRIVEIYSRSRTIIDSPQSGQSGLTMRTIEALGSRRRLITANPAVMDYDFFESGNVIVYSGGAVDVAFATADPAPIDKKMLEKYSIGTWAREVLYGLGEESA